MHCMCYNSVAKLSTIWLCIILLVIPIRIQRKGKLKFSIPIVKGITEGGTTSFYLSWYRVFILHLYIYYIIGNNQFYKRYCLARKEESNPPNLMEHLSMSDVLNFLILHIKKETESSKAIFKSCRFYILVEKEFLSFFFLSFWGTVLF